LDSKRQGAQPCDAAMDIRFLYSENCPSHEEALKRLRKVLQEENIQANIEVIRVDTEGQARKLRFLGSPTILIDGQDFDPPAEPHYALTCRAFQLEDGRISPLPSLQMIRGAVRAAVGK